MLQRVTFSVFVSMFAFLVLFTPHAHAATGDITAVRISNSPTTTNGWAAEIDISGMTSGGKYNVGLSSSTDSSAGNPANAKIRLDLTSPGFDASGNPTTISRTVYGTIPVRLPYPASTGSFDAMDETNTGGGVTVKIALSDFVYAGDTNITATVGSGFYTQGSVTNNAITIPVVNNSTYQYPKVVGRWAWPGYEIVGSNFLVEATAFNRFAQYGKPVAAVVFTATDQHGNSVSSTVTQVTKSTRTGDANVVLVYATTINTAPLTQGDQITVNFKAYPWVGTNTSTLNTDLVANGGDGLLTHDLNLGPLFETLDKDGTYGRGYALIDATATSTGVVYNSQAAAESAGTATAFKTPEAAGAAIKLYQNSTYGRNNLSGGVGLFTSGSYYFNTGSTVYDSSTTPSWFTLMPASTASRSSVTLSWLNSARFLTGKLKLQNLTIATTSTVSLVMSRQDPLNDAVWFDNNLINMPAKGDAIASLLAAYATQNTILSYNGTPNSIRGGNGLAGYGSYNAPFYLVRGNTVPNHVLISGPIINLLGNQNIYPTDTKSTTIDNFIVAYNSVYNMPAAITSAVSNNILNGEAIVQNVFENYTSGPALSFAADNSTANDVSNVMVWNNTIAGGRYNHAYNEGFVSGTSCALTQDLYLRRDNWSERNNSLTDINEKTDTFRNLCPASGARTGNWATVYGVGISNQRSLNATILHTSGGMSFSGINSFYFENGKAAPGGSPYVHDATTVFGDSSGGYGDYTLKSTTDAIDFANASSYKDQVLPFDFLGNPIYGSRDAGAYEFQPPYTMGVNQISTSTVVRTYGGNTGKFRNASTPTAAGTANLSVVIPGSDMSQYLDIGISQWDNAGLNHKVWSEVSSSTGSAIGSVLHTVGDLLSATTYQVLVDGASTTGTISGCTESVCSSDGSGKIAFTYNGTFAPGIMHLFDVQQITLPVSSSTPPIGTPPPVGTTTPPGSVNNIIASPRTSMLLEWDTPTAENTQVEYGTSLVYGSSTPVDATPVLHHSTFVTNLLPSMLYYFHLISGVYSATTTAST
jgi:hypothetical protein